MKIGIVFFSFFKMFQGKPNPISKPENYILISDSNDLKLKVEKKIQKNLVISNANNINKIFSQFISKTGTTEIIFDINHINFKDSISFIQNNNHKKVTFKLLPPNSNFIIGSNSSNDRGEIIYF